MSKVGIMGDLKGKPSWAMYWESYSMNCLTWPTDCKENIQWVGQFKVKHVNQIHRIANLIDTQKSKTMLNMLDNHETT